MRSNRTGRTILDKPAFAGLFFAIKEASWCFVEKPEHLNAFFALVSSLMISVVKHSEAPLHLNRSILYIGDNMCSYYGRGDLMKYCDLYELIQHDSQARAYFEQLPEYAKTQISTRANHINSLESLQDYAENVTRGDN